MGKGARKRRARRDDAGGATEALPALQSLRDLPSWDELRARRRQLDDFAAKRLLLEGEGVPADEVLLGCVVRLDRYFPLVMTERGGYRAEFSFRFGVVREPSAAVGDWVVLRRPAGHDMAVIEYVLGRTNDFCRWRGGSRGTRQTLAANVDLVLVVQALGQGPLSLDRVARSALIAADCGCGCVVVLTKADRLDAPALMRQVADLRALLGPGAPIVVTSTMEEDAAGSAWAQATCDPALSWGFGSVRALVPAGCVAIVLGESGAGKSTLLNALLGHEALETGAVRASDDAGRHTTVARRMVSLPGAGIVIDAPGLRSLPLVGHERGLRLLFPELDALAGHCRFRDCTHTHEPGCAVRGALGDGRCAPARLDAYVSLSAEMRRSSTTLDPDVPV
ncbi:ribosome small subunit-dependent GTPase A [Olsenella sp. HMSC062G07]|uniref:ribosome small subunit-dependent GTPase A n=1 Tax=Olsenella sp. HMSC062G07 TaxID=1739330 RepID=UPI0008A35859|nr:GTPase RsgA [Olsenella sp. HMSC062G07]OFK23443.1 ribosome small subunit-dependent GTPase [Olsenella sp. HMSC062G07]